MKRMLAFVLCLMLMFALVLPASAETPKDASCRLLYNPWNSMGADEAPDDLVSLYSLSIVVSLSSIQLDRQSASFARAMFDAMVQDGVTNYIVVSGYRNYAKQQQLYADKLASYKALGYGDEEADQLTRSIVAVPGTSEHQSGLSMDISNTAQGGTLSGNVEKSAVGAWLKERSWEFGYTLRYPKDKSNLTGIVYEPWHFRFVGAPHAQILQERGLCLEEYVSLTKDQARTVTFTDKNGITYRVFYADTPGDYNLLESGVSFNPIANEGDGFLVTEIVHSPMRTPLRWS